MTSKNTANPNVADSTDSPTIPVGWKMTPKRSKALSLGQTIRNIVCMDTIANRFFEPDLREKIRAICDEQMHILGYESITEHRERTHALWDDPKAPGKLFRYQKLPPLTENE